MATISSLDSPTGRVSTSDSTFTPLDPATTATLPASTPLLPRRSTAHKYRGATVADLDPPPALSIHPTTLLSTALLTAYERDYTHLTVVSPNTRSLLGYLHIPRLKKLLTEGTVTEADPVEKAMLKFKRSRKEGGGVYRVITLETGLEELEVFFDGEKVGETMQGGEEFAVVTDVERRFVLGVATRADLEEFVRRRPVL